MKYIILLLICIIVVCFSFQTFYEFVKAHDETEKICSTKENVIYMLAFLLVLPTGLLWSLLGIYCFYRIIEPLLRLIDL